MKQDSAELGHVGRFRVLGKDGVVRSFNAQTRGRLRPADVHADAPAVADPADEIVPDEHAIDDETDSQLQQLADHDAAVVEEAGDDVEDESAAVES